MSKSQLNSLPAGYFMLFLLSADSFSKFTFSKHSFRNTIRKSNSLDQHFVGPDLGPNFLQRLSEADKSCSSQVVLEILISGSLCF